MDSVIPEYEWKSEATGRQIKRKTLGLILTSVMPNIVGLIKMLPSIFQILLQNLKWQGVIKKK